jgi:hypothetical protein
MDKDSINVRIVLPDYLEDSIWSQVQLLLQRVLDRGTNEVTIDGIKARIMEGSELLLCAFYEDKVIACCVLGITNFETGKKVLQMPYVAGDHMDLWLEEGFDIITNVARVEKCSHIRGCGRIGWSKIMPNMKQITTTYECEV